jgi:hypothetical protein
VLELGVLLPSHEGVLEYQDILSRSIPFAEGALHDGFELGHRSEAVPADHVLGNADEHWVVAVLIELEVADLALVLEQVRVISRESL